MSVLLQDNIEKDGFRLRGTHLSRIDGFSDVVFGFALTLLVVSLEVPKTFHELQQSLRGFLPFAISFYFLMSVWYAHYQFFRRFGLHDTGTIALNAVLLFVVLFFVYPLKFLFTFLSSMLFGQADGVFESYQQVTELMVLYGLGFAAIHMLQAALYWNGYRQRRRLELNPQEEVLTRTYIRESAGVGSIGLISCILALLLPPAYSGFAGFTYALIGVFKTISGRITRRQIARFQTKQNHTPLESPVSDVLLNAQVDSSK